MKAWRILGVVLGACLGEALWTAGAGSLPEADPARWILGASSVPIEVSGLAGTLRDRPDALDLWSYRSASPRIAAVRDGTVTLTADVPDDGQLRVRLGADAPTAGPESVRRPLLSGTARPGVGGTAPNGGGAGIRPPGDGPVLPPPGSPNGGAPPNAGSSAGGVGPPNAGSSTDGGPAQGVVPPPPNGAGSGPPRLPGGAGPMAGAPPRPPERGVSLLIDRGARSSITGSGGLHCSPPTGGDAAIPAPSNPRFSLRLDARDGVLDVTVDGRPAARCTGSWQAGNVVVSSGVRRVALTSFGVHAADGTTFTDTFAAFPRGIAARILAIAAGAAAGLLLGRRRGLVLGALPIAAIPLLEHVDLRGWLDALRLIDVPEALGPLLFAGIPAAVATLLAATASLSLRRALAVGIAPMLAIAAIAAAAGFPHDTAGWLVLAATGLPLAGIGWLNTHPARLRAPLSQALCLLILLMAEGGVRLTALDTTWTRTAGWKRASEEFRELLELENYRTYPDEGFPVRPPPPDPQRRRIVALGGSSTGGAYQMDDIDQFWPKRLEEDLAGTDWEVVNQGVGGWNTLHVRLYVESQIERLDADILALYVGHNDVLAESPVPYRDLYARYAMKGSSLTAISDTLNGSRLYVGLKYAVLALKDRGGAVAVPVPDARENLAAIIDVAHQHHAKVLLMTEGLNPDPLPLRPYAAMQKELAEQTGSLYLDAATALWKTGDPDLFLDDCHLSASGHRELAGDVLATLRDAGWLK